MYEEGIMKKAILIEKFNKKGLHTIECIEEGGDLIFDALWDPTDEQTPENRIKFREWVRRLLATKGYHVDE